MEDFILTSFNMNCMFLLKNVLLIAPLIALSASDEKIAEKKFGPVQNWPQYNDFGQISAVSVDNSGNVYVFHRGDRQWDYSTFETNNVFAHIGEGRIQSETIVVLGSEQGNVIKKTGSNLFYLPHGLTIDDDNNIWVTDVALHQVFRFPPLELTSSKNLRKPNLTLGVAFEPGYDDKHFCKPTAVAVDKATKEFYVSDGYCNARIVKFDKFGKQLLHLGRTSTGSTSPGLYMLSVPHALALAQETQTLYVADREDLRVVSYDFASGKFKNVFAKELKSKIFSVAYTPLKNGLLFVLTNDNSGSKLVAVYNAVTRKLILSFSPKNNFTNPHDLAISPDGEYCYVVELNPHKIWKFKLDINTISEIDHKTSDPTEIPEQSVIEPVPAESKIDKTDNSGLSSSYLAVALVISVVAIGCFAFMFHYYRRDGGYRRYESRRLILDDDEGGIRLS